MSELSGKVALITGAARGIGAASARELAGRGARLVLTDVDDEPLTALVSELGANRAVSAVCDVRDLSSMQAAVETGVERFGGIDLVLANAGICSYGSILVVDPDSFKNVIDINITGVFNTVRAALPSLIERRGYVLIVSSLAAFVPLAGLAPYCASKAGIEQFAGALRLEVGHRGVGVGSAHMSWIDTPLVRDAKDDLPSFQRMLDLLPAPARKTTSADACARAFVRGMARRKRRVYVPRWVGVLAWLRPVLNTSAGERPLREQIPELMPIMDAEVQALGRTTSARNVRVQEETRAGQA